MWLRKILRLIRLKKRQKAFKKRFDKVKPVTILSSNCWGGIIYHDASMQFYSPTINLTFEPLDFIYFVNHINEIKNTSMTECIDANRAYPVGLLTFPSGKAIKVLFVHYNSFAQAKEKFYERYLRLLDNIVVLFSIRTLTDDIVTEFKKIPYKKVCIFGETLTDSNRLNDDFIYFEKIINSKRDILSFRSPTGKRLIIDSLCFDYYSFVFSNKNKKSLHVRAL